jgi:hypothetical protein
MVDHREGVIASSEQQFATPHSPSSHSDRSHLFLGLTETVALISNRFNGLAQATPRFNRLAELAACVPLAPMPYGNQLEVEETSRVQLQSEYDYL